MDRLYDFAIDIGTTNVEIALIDDNVFVDSIIEENNQKAFGKDVITRITNSKDETKLLKMNSLIIEQIQIIMNSLIIKNNISTGNIKNICIVGNTTMLSILLSYDITSLGEYPFTIFHKHSEKISAKELFPIFEQSNAKIIILGCASAFVGADSLAGQMYINNYKDSPVNEYKLLVDLGTNAEIILWNDSNIFADSAPCGPAFEKCLQKQNLFGTNIIDAISLGINSKKINRDGTIEDEDKDKDKDAGISVLGVNIDNELLRENMLGIASLFSSMNALNRLANIEFSDISNIYISGGFGSNLNIDNAINIGLFPNEFKNKISIFNNTAILGAKSACKDETFYKRLDKLIDNIEIIQNAGNKDFENDFVSYLNFYRR